MLIQYIHVCISIILYIYIDVQFLEIIPRSFEIPDPHDRACKKKADEDELAEAPKRCCLLFPLKEDLLPRCISKLLCPVMFFWCFLFSTRSDDPFEDAALLLRHKIWSHFVVVKRPFHQSQETSRTPEIEDCMWGGSQDCHPSTLTSYGLCPRDVWGMRMREPRQKNLTSNYLEDHPS